MLYFHLFNIHKRVSQKDILILTTGRSGGTWLLELISYQKGIRSISEPLSLSLVTHPRVNEFGSFRAGNGYSFIQKPIPLKSYFEDIFSGKLNPFSPIKTFRKNFRTYHYFTNRSVVKVCHGKGLIKWFAENFDVDIIYFYRHPVPTALSMIKRRFNTKLAGLLEDELFIQKYLSEKQLQFAKKIQKDGSEIEKFVLSWTLENIIPLKTISNGFDCYKLSYEELVLFPQKCIEWLSNNFKLNKAILEKKFHLSSSTTIKSFQKDEYKKNSSLINSWRNGLSEKVEKRIFEIVENYDVDLYTFGEDLPNKKYLNKSIIG